jgi:hypothetical protein
MDNGNGKGPKSAPRCWWCHESIGMEVRYRGSAPELQLPSGHGVVVCTPACPARPATAQVELTHERDR